MVSLLMWRKTLSGLMNCASVHVPNCFVMAVSNGFLSENDASGATGLLSQAASSAIEALLEFTLIIPEPSEDECRRHYTAHQALYTTGERVNARHILFAVTQGVDVVALRNRSETCLLDVRCHDGSNPEDRFAKAASTLSNCPSGAEGGHLGWLSAADCAPGFPAVFRTR